MENPKLYQALLILHVALMEAEKKPDELDKEHVYNLAREIADWISVNWGIADFEVRREILIHKLSEEIKNIY